MNTWAYRYVHNSYNQYFSYNHTHIIIYTYVLYLVKYLTFSRKNAFRYFMIFRLIVIYILTIKFKTLIRCIIFILQISTVYLIVYFN